MCAQALNDLEAAQDGVASMRIELAKSQVLIPIFKQPYIYLPSVRMKMKCASDREEHTDRVESVPGSY